MRARLGGILGGQTWVLLQECGETVVVVNDRGAGAGGAFVGRVGVWRSTERLFLARQSFCLQSTTHVDLR